MIPFITTPMCLLRLKYQRVAEKFSSQWLIQLSLVPLSSVSLQLQVEMSLLAALSVSLQSLKIVEFYLSCKSFIVQHKIFLVGNLQVPSSINDPQPKTVLIHQNITFSLTAIKIMWTVLNDRRCTHYQLVGSQSCDASSNAMVIINRTEENTINILEPNVLSNLMYFSLTVYDERGQQCTRDLEPFKFSPECKFITSC